MTEAAQVAAVIPAQEVVMIHALAIASQIALGDVVMIVGGTLDLINSVLNRKGNIGNHFSDVIFNLINNA